MVKVKNLLYLFVLVIAACSQREAKDPAKLNGYWEIEKVIMPDGSKKEYSVNQTIDQFIIDGKSGIRKKVMPTLDGKYTESGHSEKVTISSKDGEMNLHYATEYAKWAETVTELTDSILTVKNDQKIEYHYKRHKPFSLK